MWSRPSLPPRSWGRWRGDETVGSDANRSPRQARRPRVTAGAYHPVSAVRQPSGSISLCNAVVKGEVPMVSLDWIKCNGGKWCPLQSVNLANVNVGGVYLIWHEGNPGRVVRLGQGDIANRLSTHRSDSEITAYAQHGTLRVTWAAVPSHQRDGVERYLADQWPPLVGDAFPNASPIAVNSPWA